MSQLDGSDEDDMNIGPDANLMEDDDDGELYTAVVNVC
jgi:hypothetical protein